MNERGDVRCESPDALAGVAMERSHLYGFLARIFRMEITADFLRELRDPAFRNQLTETGVDLGDAFFDGPEENVLEDLAMEYALLFLGPGKHISPHESVQSGGGDGDLFGEVAADVKRFIEYSGFTFEPEYTGLPDHISVELDFMKKLCAREAEAWRKGAVEDAENCVSFQEEFNSAHLSNWVPAFGAKVVEGATMPFYGEMAKLLTGFIEAETVEMNTRRQTALP